MKKRQIRSEQRSFSIDDVAAARGNRYLPAHTAKGRR